jgi:hypothetical protein
MLTLTGIDSSLELTALTGFAVEYKFLGQLYLADIGVVTQI